MEPTPAPMPMDGGASLTVAQMSSHVVMRFVSGGVIVYAWQPGADGEWGWQTSVFNSLDSLAEYVKRVGRAMEGPEESEELKPGQKFGGMKVE